MFTFFREMGELVSINYFLCSIRVWDGYGLPELSLSAYSKYNGGELMRGVDSRKGGWQAKGWRHRGVYLYRGLVKLLHTLICYVIFIVALSEVRVLRCFKNKEEMRLCCTWSKPWTIRDFKTSEYLAVFLENSESFFRASSKTVRTWSSRTFRAFRRAWFNMFDDWLEKDTYIELNIGLGL